MSEDSIDIYDIKKWRSSDSSFRNDAPGSNIPRMEIPTIELDGRPITSDKDLSMPRNFDSLDPLGLSKQEPRKAKETIVKESTKGKPTRIKEPKTTVSNSNPLGMSNKDLPKPPKFAKVTKVKALNGNLWKSNKSPKLSPNTIVTPPKEPERLRTKAELPPHIVISAPKITPDKQTRPTIRESSLRGQASLF